MKNARTGLAIPLFMLLLTAALLSGCEDTPTFVAPQNSNPPTTFVQTMPTPTSATQTTNQTKQSTATQPVTTITLSPSSPPAATQTIVPPPAQSPLAVVATVSIVAPEKVTAGSDFTASINISPVTHFNGTNYSIGFDPNVLRLDDITAGMIGDTVMPVTGYNIVKPGNCNVLQFIPALGEANGVGRLAVLHFHALGGQTSRITLSNGVIANVKAEKIGADWISTSVSVY